ncbi:PAS domain-containing sensor histidine kinase [Christiangramia fulva]|uniref:histidine kinase n=1 Tax=Christiangramia fulva TaxID=2126553 RepID=A0A2R3Z260_9FLAO|nr:PAS domain-containing sensor histidine kinase [Christiangramia fulva]AVR44357.1 PAS domain-containing sensor histidine kinase [Christiangramia fulva]
MDKSFLDNSNLFNVLFQAASEGIIVVNSKQIIVTANAAAESMFGYETGELPGKHLDILIPKEYHKNHHHHFNNFIDHSEKRQMGHGRDLHGVTKDGRRFPVEAGLNPFRMDGEDYVMSLVIDISVRKETQRQIRELNNELEEKIKVRTSELRQSVRDLQKLNLDLEEEISKRKEAEKRIKNALQKEKELNELKTKFLSLVSHEFKTPLSGILTSATLIEKYRKEDQQEKREKHLGTIRNKVHYLNNILNDFLSIERLDSGKGQYKYTSFSLKRLINEVVYNANITLKTGQEIIYPKDIEDVMLHQDEKILELILSNLLSNAVKYSPEDTVIKFNTAFTGDKILFEVEDQGRGIPEKDQKHIFERYFRAENALLDQGTGIGLNIAKTHLENMGGSISFESEENKGTRFKVEVPVYMG